jgi:glycosyltransferase involved in cell wall biosynthesis
MKFSIIIPAHNEELFIGRTLRAVLEQTHSVHEVIVVDNASSDDTYTVARQFPITVVKEEQEGTMAACEKGRSIATGDVIVRLDADCLPDEDWLAKADKIFQNEKVVALSGPYAFYDAGKFFSWSRVWQQKIILGTANIVMQWFGKSAITNGGNSMFRASALALIGGFDKSIVFYGDDTNVAKRIAKLGKVIFSPSFVMKTSARRFQKEGRLNTQAKYLFHFFKESFRNRE